MELPNLLKRNGWRASHFVGAALLAAIAALVTRGAFLDIFEIAWRSEESSYIFLVPLVFVWLIWVRRERMRLCYPVGQWLGPVIMLAGWGISWFGYLNAVQSFWHGGSILVVIGAAISVLGSQVMWQFLPAIVMLGFLVPVPGLIRQQIAMPLQTATAAATHHLFELLGFYVPRTGNMLTINGTPVGIAEACNGLRMVFALVVVSYAFAFSTPLRWYVRAAIIGLSPISAILCNVVRLLPTVWLYGHSPEPWANTFHDYAGWGMLLVAFLLLMGVIRLLRWASIPVRPYTLAYD